MRNPTSPLSSAKSSSSPSHRSSHLTIYFPSEQNMDVSSSQQASMRNFSASSIRRVNDTNVHTCHSSNRSITSSSQSSDRRIYRLLDLFKQLDIRGSASSGIHNTIRNEIFGRIVTKVLNTMNEEDSFETRQLIIELLQETVSVVMLDES